jgi:hypothetical protein
MLNAINKADTDKCDCGCGNKHILPECRNLMERQQMWAGKHPGEHVEHIFCSPTMAVQAATMGKEDGASGPLPGRAVPDTHRIEHGRVIFVTQKGRRAGNGLTSQRYRRPRKYGLF